MGLLGASDSQPVIAGAAGSAAPFLLICDHAGREVPAALKRLGLPEASFDLHIAWDIGAAEVTRGLAEILGAPFILQRYSRLVIDCNRDPASPDAIPDRSDGIVIPGNRGLTAEARQARVAAVHAPYHGAIAAELDRRRDLGLTTILVFVHSFTPRMAGFDRPWRFGVVREPTSRFSRLMLEALQAVGGFQVGDNLPYAMDGIDYSVPAHALARGLEYVELEMRQDTVADAVGQRETSHLLAGALSQAAARLSSSGPGGNGAEGCG